jgi:uncharacterized repeat protein (TIGR01451 family)
LAITITDNKPNPAPGETITYTITATNNGPSAVTGASVAETLNNLSNVSWTCSKTGDASCPASGSGNGAVNETINLGPGGSVVFKVTATAPPSGNIANSVEITPPGGVGDPAAANNTASDNDTVV